MTDIDIVAELRRLYAAAPQGKWTCEGPDFHGYRIFSADEKVLNHTLTEAVETADLIVAMHEALPALLRMVESLRLYVRHMEQDNPDDPDQWIYLMGRRWEAIVAALAKLKQGEVTHD